MIGGASSHFRSADHPLPQHLAETPQLIATGTDLMPPTYLPPLKSVMTLNLSLTERKHFDVPIAVEYRL